MIFKLNLQLFGGSPGEAANETEALDLTPGNKTLDFKIGNNTYSVPIKAFDNVGSQDNDVSWADRMMLAQAYTAYWLSTGVKPAQDSLEVLSDIKAWYFQETGQELTFNSSDESMYDTIKELSNIDKSMQKNMPSYLQTGSAKVNGQEYHSWREQQPQLQPGYTKELGAPVAKDADGNYIYKQSDGTLVNEKGVAIAEGTTLYAPKTGAAMVMGLDGTFRDAVTGAVINDPNKGTSATSAREDALNQYYNELFSRKEGTLGADILANNISLYEKEAANAELVAETSLQQQALAQAQAVKQVTDSLRSERMSQLRAGMSEAQLADRELSMLVGSTNQLSAQATQASQDVLTAKLGGATAQEQAFNDYITQTTALGQNAAAMYAADAGDLHAKALQYQHQMAAEGQTVSYKQAIDVVSGQTFKANNGG